MLSKHPDGERGGLVVNASDSGSRGRGFESHSGQTVLCPLASHIHSPKVLVIPRERWLRPNMTDKNVYRDVQNQSTSILTVQKNIIQMIVNIAFLNFGEI